VASTRNLFKPMCPKAKILVIGACGGIGPELTIALRSFYGKASVVAAGEFSRGCRQGACRQLDLSDKTMLSDLIRQDQITQIFLLPGTCTAGPGQDASGERDRQVTSLVHILEAAAEHSLDKVFWPSSNQVFGPGMPKHSCRQETAARPDSPCGISKLTGEYWCKHYFEKHGLDFRSIRLPALVFPAATPSGDLISYAAEMVRHALDKKTYTCYLREDSCLPVIYLPDAIRAVLMLMEAPAPQLSVRTSYNLSGLSFSPCDLAAEIRKYLPDFRVTYEPDSRQAVANQLPVSVNDQAARLDWLWRPAFGLGSMVADILKQTGQTKKSWEQLPAPAFDDQYCFTRIDES
jgi:nucleoside-diphosphate-sugar epimerase